MRRVIRPLRDALGELAGTQARVVFREHPIATRQHPVDVITAAATAIDPNQGAGAFLRRLVKPERLLSGS